MKIDFVLPWVDNQDPEWQNLDNNMLRINLYQMQIECKIS